MLEFKEDVASAISRAKSELEDALSKLEKMPTFDDSSVAFAAHALNNYLTVSGGAIELMMVHLADYPDPQIRVWLESLQQAMKLMARTVGQLMLKQETADTQFRFEKVDLSLLVQRVCGFYQRVANRKRICVNTDPDVNIQPVWTDRVAIAAVFDNLLSNAIKYSEPDKQVWVQVQSEKDWVVCRVKDEGPGLSQQDQARLFRRGVILTPRPTADEPSTGYGLAVARELIEKLGGEIWCESQLGQGSCFAFRLPAHKEPVPDTRSDSE